MRYSVAIRTLGLNPDMLRQELESVFAQTIKPERVVIYIADGYEVPDFRVGDEMYVPVRKGMVAQRALRYDEIDTPLILLLDDDVVLSADSVQRLVTALLDHDLDCISPDTFANHKMTFRQRVYSAVSNMTFAHADQSYAFKLCRNGSFSFVAEPKRDVLLSQTAAGPCSLWRKDRLVALRFWDELWLDHLGFAYNDDGLEFYKLFVNGGRLGIHFGAGVAHVGGKTSSDVYKRDPQRFYKRAKAEYMVWHRQLMSWRRGWMGRMMTVSAFWLKIVLTMPAICAAAVFAHDIRVPWLHIRGLADGVRHAKSVEYRTLPPYKFDHPIRNKS